MRSALLLAVLLCSVGWPAHAAADRVGRLIQILDKDRSYKVRLRVVITLTKIEDRRVAPALTRALSDRSHLVRALAARALAEIGATEALPLIRRMARKDRKGYVRRMAARSARRLARRKARPGGRTRFFLRVGKLHNHSRGGRTAVARFRRALLDEFRRVPGVTTRLGNGAPTAAVLRERQIKGYELSGSIRRLGHRRSGSDLKIHCSVRVELSTYPGSSMKAFYAGEANMTVTSRNTTRRQLDVFYREIIAGAAREARDHIVRSYLDSQ